jgi:hypothetical protein
MQAQSKKEIEDMRKYSGRSGQKAITALYGTPSPSPATTKAPKPAVSKSKLKTIRKFSGRANMPALAAWGKGQEKKPARKRVAAKR